MPLAQGTTGSQNNADGNSPVLGFRQGRQGEIMASGLHGRFYEQNRTGAVYSGGMTVTSIANATFTTATVGATATPIVGLYNPLTSGLNAVVLQAMLAVTMTALQNTGCGAFMWATSAGQTLSLGSAPVNRKTLLATGSVMKDMSGIALTGLTVNLSIRNASALMGGSAKALAELDTAIGLTTTMTGCPIEQIDGSWIVPPGGVLALLCTTTPVAHSAASGIVWEEVPV